MSALLTFLAVCCIVSLVVGLWFLLGWWWFRR